MKRITGYAVIVVLALLVAGASGCGRKTEAKPRVDVPPVAVEVVTVAGAELADGIEVTGELTPKYEAEVKTEIPGLVKELYVAEWVRVRKGQPLARIALTETEALVQRGEANVESARAALLQTRVAAERCEREKARVLRLKEGGLATQQSVDDALSESEAARARIEAAQAQVRAAEGELTQLRARLAKGLVRSPIDGVVSAKDVNVGSLTSDAASARPIFKIVDNRLMNLTVTVPTAGMAKVRLGQPLQFTTDAVPGKSFTGRVMFINPSVNVADRSLKVIAEVPNVPEVLKSGLFAKGRIVTGVKQGALLVPRGTLSGLDLDRHKATLFVAHKGVAQQREVVTGAVSGDLVEIVSGLAQGEHLISRGGFNVKHGDAVTVAAAVK